MARKLLIGWVLWCAIPLAFSIQSLSWAAEKGEAFVGPLFKQLGVRPDEMPERVTATVEDPEKLNQLGLEAVRAGDGIELTDEGGGKIRLRHIATDRTLEIILK